MALLVWAFVGGLVGTFIMDVGARGLAKLGVNDALGGLLGRWLVGFARFEFVIDGHKEMKSPKTLFESRLGVAFHYIFGGGGVALVYPAWFAYTDFAFPDNQIVPGLIFGALSVGLTWFLQYPCFGFGVFGRRGPEGSSTILPPIFLHSLYGLNIGVVLQTGLQVC